MYSFELWDKEFREHNMYAFNNNQNGLLWLKVRAICRLKQINQFCAENNITLISTKVSEKNIELFNLLENRNDAMTILDRFLQAMNHEWYTAMDVDTERLKDDLYKVRSYIWGGDQNNSLDKYLISRYVKTISDFTELQSRQSEIASNAWNYVQNSWYNNWTSFLIESLFKRNPNVISAVGEIKNVDFFIGSFPIDLKVTFFPNQFMELKFKEISGRNILGWLKCKCKETGITADKSSTTGQQVYTLTEKLAEQGYYEIINELNLIRRNIIIEAGNNPYELMKWLYENQGEMRFGAENRLYLILADTENPEQSWKMKRAFSLIEPKVDDYIKNFSISSLKKITFEYNKKSYTSLSDVLFITK